MLSVTVCGLLLLPLGGLAVALTINAFPCLALVALGAVPSLVTSLATSATRVVIVPTVPLCFHFSRLGTLACVIFIRITALQLGPRRGH